MYWFNLHKLIEDGSGFYGYGQKWHKSIFHKRRTGISIHPKVTYTNGCIAAEQFDKVRAILNQAEVKYNNRNFCGFLNVVWSFLILFVFQFL
jgi:hypothetical protein